MSEPSLDIPAVNEGSPSAATVARESGLQRNLTPAQLAMLGLGSTIGTGLFLGSAIAVKLAGPAVILSFVAGACIALPMMWALAEMAAAHPTAGSFGLYAEMYLHPWAGFAIRLTYWLCMMVVVGSEVVAASIYCKFWFPGIPAWIWIGLFSLVILYVNTTNIGSLGTFEYWLSMVKVVTIVAFLILGTALLFGWGFPKVGLGNFTAHGGFLPNGWNGVGLGVILGLFSFFGIEVVGSTAGEAADPKVAVPKALRNTVTALVLFYVAGLALVVGIVPWTQIGMGESPFVRVFQTVGIPAASHIMNFVVLTAALSSAVANLYFAARLAFSLARGGYLPLVRLHDRAQQLWRALRLAHDPLDAPRVSPLPSPARETLLAAWTSGPMGFSRWPCRRLCCHALHLVGPRFPRHPSGRPPLARPPHGVLLCVEKELSPHIWLWRVVSWIHF